ncbi:T9SS type A sorting domain-containing protein [Flavobacterium humi]|uniref:T9SS type A sorting domain-containing protein n=1 Tax=Flavobacterium humi TaxID=2562683 RepID=A0A4Z0L6Q9_9FLAO|nr:T9SS type A sorting domain-containing protein [Flavobacterium humi]TGD57246.1 T9SS type A sorting domain-containing protein [Flavobacterium humi]
MKKLLLLSIFLAANGAIYSQWTQQATGFTSASTGVDEIDIIDANTVWAKAYDGSAAGDNYQLFTRTTNGGTSWTPGAIDVGNPILRITNISAVSATTAWAGAFDEADGLGGVWKTTDGGVTWTQQNATAYTTAGSSWFNMVHFFNANNGITMGDPAGTEFEVYRTTDGGATWSAPAAASIPNPAAGEYGYNGGVVAAGNTLWFTTNKGKLYRTTDMGVTWTKLNGPVGLNDFGSAAINGKPYFSNNNNGIIIGTLDSGATYKLWKTTNGGTTWDAGATYTAAYRSVSYIPGTNTLVGTGSTGTGPATIQYSGVSYDNGTTWTQIDTGTQRTSVSFLNGTTGWAGGFTTSSFVGGIYKYTGTSLGVADFNTTSEFNVYPNPTSGLVKLSSSLNTVSNVAVYDVLGKQVFTKAFSALNNEVEVDLSSLNTGVYFLKATANNGGVQTIRIVRD